jgi:hypothetical protein
MDSARELSRNSKCFGETSPASWNSSLPRLRRLRPIGGNHSEREATPEAKRRNVWSAVGMLGVEREQMGVGRRCPHRAAVSLQRTSYLTRRRRAEDSAPYLVCRRMLDRGDVLARNLEVGLVELVPPSPRYLRSPIPATVKAARIRFRPSHPRSAFALLFAPPLGLLFLFALLLQLLVVEFLLVALRPLDAG